MCTHLYITYKNNNTFFFSLSQLAEAWQEVDGVRSWAHELQSRVEELQEEMALQEKSHNDTSLLSELENNLDTTKWSLDKEQVIH